MNYKELRRMSRRDLLEMLLNLTKENERLQKENEDLEEKLRNRTVTIQEAGSVAEAALQLNGVFQTAQDAADQYLLNMQQRCQRMEEETVKRCKQMILDAKIQVKRYEKEKYK